VRLSIHLQPRAKDVQRWSRGDVPARLVKANNAREVWLVPLGSPGLYVKRFPAEILRDRAAKEAGLLQALEEAGIPCPRFVALARDKKGSYILTEEIPDARPLADLLKEATPLARVLLQDLGRLSRKLHDAGFDHQDFHAGNVLVRDTDLYVIDVHRAGQKKSLSHDRRLDRVAFTAMSFMETRPRTDLLRFFKAYGLTKKEEWVDVWARLRKLHHEYFLGRQKRVFKEGTGFGIKGSLYYRKGIDLDAIVHQIDHGRREVIRKTRTETLERVDGTLFVKATTPARAKKIWENSQGLLLRGIDTPRLWILEKRWVAGEWVESVDLTTYIQTHYETLVRTERLAFVDRLARIVRRLHDYGAYHGDLKAGNVLVGSGRVLIIDLDRVRFSETVSDARRRYNLAQLNAAVTPPLTRTDRLRFLDAYLGNCKAWRQRRGEWIRELMAATRARKHRWPLQ